MCPHDRNGLQWLDFLRCNMKIYKGKRSKRLAKAKGELIYGCEHSNYSPDQLATRSRRSKKSQPWPVALDMSLRAPYGVAKQSATPLAVCLPTLPIPKHDE